MRKFFDLTAAIAVITALFVSFSSAGPVRRPAVAGSFYPDNKEELSQLVEKQLHAVNNLPEINGQIMAIVVPHAGLVYSGPIAAYAYKLIENRGFNKAIICGPSHRYAFDGISVYGPYVGWSTPLGSILCENKYTSHLIKFDDKITFDPKPHLQEHSIEVQLPFLQIITNNNLEISPVLMGSQTKENIDILSNALKSLDIDDSTIMVASTDWQHYRSAKDGYTMDSLGMNCLANLDPVRLEMYLQKREVEMCGGGPVVAVMKAAIARGANKVKILKYGDSGDLTGDKSSVVGYVAAVIYKSDNSGKDKVGGTSKSSSKEKKLPEQFKLDDADKQTLLKIARSSLNGYLSEGKVPDFKVNENLQKFGAAFVTLEEGGNLRGCIGYTTAVEPLYQTVSDCAVKAAVADPRFPPVTKDELDKIHIEISVMSPMQIVESLDEIKVGRDGLMIFKGKNRGLLLPQVAVDNNWDRTEFLKQTCRKAGLAPDAYLESDAVIYKFQAVIFEE